MANVYAREKSILQLLNPGVVHHIHQSDCMHHTNHHLHRTHKLVGQPTTPLMPVPVPPLTPPLLAPTPVLTVPVTLGRWCWNGANTKIVGL